MKSYDSKNYTSECGRVIISCQHGTPIGVVHDILLEVKGNMVALMVQEQNKSEEAMEKQIAEEVSQQEVKEAAHD